MSDYGIDDLIAGYEDEDNEEVGRRTRRKRTARGRKVERKIQRAILTGQTAPETALRPFGMGYGTLSAANQTLQLDAIAQEPFVPVRPVIDVTYDSTYAGGQVILSDIKSGAKSQLLGVEGGSASAFSPDAQNVVLKGDVIPAGITVTMDFLVSATITAGNAYVSAWLLGQSNG